MKKKVLWCLITLAAFLGLSLLILDDHYAQAKPREPFPEVGQIHPHVAGFGPKTTVYLTDNELAAFYLLLGASAVSGLAAGALNATWKLL